MRDLSVLIPARNEQFLKRTIDDVLANMRTDTEIIAVLDGQWAEPAIPDHPRVTLVYHAQARGQRQAVNLAAKLSNAKYIMKLDAHCSVAEGFDLALMDDCEHDWTVIPRMYNLHVFDWVCMACGNRTYQGGKPATCEKCSFRDFRMDMVWKPRWNRRSDFMRFDGNLHFQYWRDYEKRPEAQGEICDLMCFVGACFFMERSRFWELGGLDEEHGSWGQMGVEISCKSWLFGGRLVVNKKTWFAHLFRTQPGFGFPYNISHAEQERAREYSRDLWLNDKWPGAVRPFEWLIEKFAPVPDWESVDA
jgi:glycosyltransferase involved in cell wall biosynthesis